MPLNTETSKPSTSNQHKTSSKSNVKRGSDETLFETLMSDPIKKAFLLNLLKNEKENIKKYKEQEHKSPAVKKKRLYCESPTALLRRRALEKNVEQRSRSNSCSPVSSSIPFSQLLKGVVAYVDIKSKGIDRSAGAKTLMESMGAKVAERLERGVTHVVFKDSSFLTYQKAKLLKAHLVSVLWLEAVRKFNCRVPEKNYPALGTEAYDVNVSEIFQEYESVVNEEYRRSMAFNNKKKSRLTALPSELGLSQNKRPSFSRRMSSIVPSSQEFEVESIISSRSLCSSRTNSEINHMNDETSDDDSECGLINGNSFSQLKRSLLFDLEHQLNDYEERAHTRSENVLENLFNKACETNSEPAKMNQSNIARLQNDILANNDRSVSTSSSRSASLLSRKSIVSDKTSNTTAEMDLTNIARRTPEKSFKRKTLHLGDESIFDHKSKKKRQSMPVSNNSSQSSHSCVELSGTPLSMQTDTVSVPVDTTKNQNESRDLSTSNPQASTLSQLQEGPLQNNLENSSNDERGELIHRPKNSDTMTTITVSKDSESGLSTRRSSRLSKSSHSSEIKNKSCEHLESLKVNKNSDDLMSPLRISADSAPIVGSLQKSLRLSQSVPNVLSLQRQESSGVNKKLSNQKSSRFSTVSSENNSFNSKTNDGELKRIHVRRSSRFVRVNANNNQSKSNVAVTDGNLDKNIKSSRRTEVASLELTDESSANHLAETSSRKCDQVSNSNSSGLASGAGKLENDLESEANNSKNSDVGSELIAESSLQKNTSLGSNRKSTRLSKPSTELTNNSTDNRITPSSSNKSNNAEQRRSSRFTKNNTDSTVSQAANTLEGGLELEANKSKNVDASSLTTRNCLSRDGSRKSTKSGSSTEQNGNQKSTRLTKSSSEIFEKPLDSNQSTGVSRNSKSSEAMSSLRISEDSASNRENRRSSRSSQSKSEVILSTAAKENRESRNSFQRSLRRSTLSKNSETMPSLRISSESSLSKSSRLDRNDHIENTKTDDRPTSKKGKKVRKLFNVNQSASQIQELANTDNGNKEVFALPIPVISPNAKTLIVPLTRMIFPGKQKNLKRRRPQTQDNSNKEPVKAKTPVGRKRKIVETTNPNRNPADNVDDEYQNTSLTVPNVSLLQTQLAATGSRRSTLEFIDKSLPRKKIQKEKRVQTGIVCTRMHKPEMEFFLETVKKLGSFYVEDEVSENTSHLVVGESKRTINLLKAIGRGCWIVTKSWLQKSIEAGKWVEEEDYELVNFSPAVKQCRMEKQAFGDLYSMDIFKECLPIYISKQTNPKRSDLIELIKLGNGTITRQINDAKIIIGDCINREGVKCVTEKWVLDSISFNKKKGFSKYLIRNRS